MRRKLWHHFTLSCLLTLSCANGVWARPEGFSDYTFEQALSKARENRKFLLIDFMATWCPPCKEMEEDTWPNQSVQAWIEENAIAIQFDVDKNEKVASAFKIKAMPTIILFTPQSGSKEFGRQVGGLGSSDLLQWLEGAKGGKTAEAMQTEENVENVIWPHLTGARDLLRSHKYDQALKEYLWVWDNVPSTDKEHADMREKLLPIEVKQLIAAHPPSRQRFTEIRDAAEKGGNRHDWVILNNMLGDDARTLAWFDKAKTDAKQKRDIIDNTTFLEPVLFAKCRWADAASYLYPEPLKKISEFYKEAEAIKKPRPDTEIAEGLDPMPGMVILVYGAYIGAGREPEAQKIADECYRLDNTPAMHQSLQSMEKAMRQARALQIKAAK